MAKIQAKQSMFSPTRAEFDLRNTYSVIGHYQLIIKHLRMAQSFMRAYFASRRNSLPCLDMIDVNDVGELAENLFQLGFPAMQGQAS